MCTFCFLRYTIVSQCTVHKAYNEFFLCFASFDCVLGQKYLGLLLHTLFLNDQGTLVSFLQLLLSTTETISR
jgi:hypothetical protein